MNEKYTITYECANYAQYKRILEFIAHDEHKTAQEQEREGTRLVFDPTNAQTGAQSYEGNVIDCGRYGRGYEVRVREFLTDKVERVHAQGQTDIRYKRRAVECKSSACWLVNPLFDSAESLQAFLDSTPTPMKGATYICYAPITKDENGIPFENVENISYILTQREFLKTMKKANVLQVKKRNGLFGLAVKQFYQSKRLEQALFDALDESNYMTLLQFKKFCEGE